MIPIVSAQTTLYPNATLENESMWGRNEVAYESNLYQVSLEDGHWTVVVQTTFDLEVKITVATDSNMNNTIATSGSDWGNFPRVDFDLASNDTVAVRYRIGIRLGGR